MLDCESLEAELSEFGDCAVLTHRVRTRLRTQGEELTLEERESIVFARQDDGRWLCIHEHLSAGEAV